MCLCVPVCLCLAAEAHGGGREQLFVLFKAESFKGSDDSVCIVTYGATFSCTGLAILTHTGACFSGALCVRR